MTSKQRIHGVSQRLQHIARLIDLNLMSAAGERVSFVLLVNTDGVCQFVENVSREDAIRIMRHQLSEHEAGTPAIPAHEQTKKPRKA